MATTSANAQIALGADLVSTLYKLSGTGLKIGVMSDSYNNGGTAAREIANGDLPANVNVLSDTDTGGEDEGQAMLELIHKIAPDATLYFANGYSDPDSATPDLQTAADAVNSLRQAGCNIIVDDLGYGIGEGFYQVGTPLDLAIQAAVADGVNYFSTAANDGNNYYEHGFVGTSTTIAGIGSGVFATFGNGTTFLNVTIPHYNPNDPDAQPADFQMEWAQPFASIGNSAGAQNSLAMYLLDSQGRVVASTDDDQVGYDPTQELFFKNHTDSTSFQLVIRQNGGVVPTGQLFKIVPNQQSAVFTDPDAGTGSGSIFGHALLAGQNTVAAVPYSDTPAFGVSPATAEDFTSTGPGTILFDENGNPLTTPVSTDVPAFAGVDGSSTGVPGYAPFYGTSAAAPNLAAVAALMLQANGAVTATTAGTLTTGQLTALMAQSAIPADPAAGVNVTADLATGAGLVQARAAVELAAAAGGTVWSNAAGGDWTAGANWAGGATPTASGPTMLGNNLGAITASYQVSVSTPGAVTGALTLNAAGDATTTLAIGPSGTLSVGGATDNDPTAGDFLVARGGQLLVQGGTLTVAESINTNDGSVIVQSGAAGADNYAQTAGSLTVGGGSGAGLLTLTGLGLSETGGIVTVAASGTIDTTALSVSAAAFTVLANGSVNASGAIALSNGAVFSDSGAVTTAAALTIDAGLATVLAGGQLAVGGLLLGSPATGAEAASLDVSGTVIDDGLLESTDHLAGSVTLEQGGLLSIAGGTLDVGIDFNHGGTLDFSSSDDTVLTTGLTSVLSGFGDGLGEIDFSGIAYQADDSYSYSDGTFSLLQDGTTLANLMFDDAQGAYGSFAVDDDATGHVLVKAVACYLRGTLLATPDGEVQVDALRPGDLVLTASGEPRPVRWIGTRAYDERFVRDNPAVMPIRFAPGSLSAVLGADLPRRPLLVSPEHAMALDGNLVPAKLLLNGTTIVPATGLSTVEYFHVELDSHDILLAEGAPSESFVDCDSRAMFQNAHTFTGAAARWSFCAPRVEQGPALAAILSRLRGPNGLPSGVTYGHLDFATHEQCAGWAWCPNDAAATLEVEILVDGHPIGRCVANGVRPDVQSCGFGHGRYGFAFSFARPLDRFRPHQVTARVLGGAALVGSASLDAAPDVDMASLEAALQARAATPEGAFAVESLLHKVVTRSRRRRSRKPLALVIDEQAPVAGRDAGSNAVLGHMRSLQRLGFRVLLVPLDGAGSPRQGVPMAPPGQSVEEVLRRHSDAALVYVHRLAGMALYGSLIRRHVPRARLVYAVADLHFLRIGRQSVVENSPDLLAESRRLRAAELAAARLADVVITHSAAEAELLRRLVPGTAVHVVPWPVARRAARRGWNGRHGLLFVGSPGHAPNADGLNWLTQAVLPLVNAADPSIACAVAGGLMAGGTTALGHVADLADAYAGCRLAVAPLRFGAGLKGKVIEAFAHGVPCIMTPVASEGFLLPEPLRALVAPDAQSFAAAILRLHADPAAWSVAADAGLALAREGFSQAAVDTALGAAVTSARAVLVRSEAVAA